MPAPATHVTPAPATAAAPLVGASDRFVHIRAAHALVADLAKPNRAIYWTDFAASAAIGWTALVAGASFALPRPLTALAFVVATFALYRAALFIHELTHLRTGAVPGFLAAWNALVGVPLLLPSFLYVGVHLDHHRRTRYGTPLDPEYLPLAHHPLWRQALFLLEALFVPLALFLRFALATPLSFLHPRLRRLVIERASSLSINPAFVRRLPAGRERLVWLALEIACSLWSLALAALVAFGVLPFRSVAYGFAVATAVTVVNQIRTMAAHHFENAAGAEMGIDEQLLDSVNVPGHPFFTELWAPVGLRYHGLHHYLPALPYHALGTAHRRLVAALPPESPYRRTISPSLVSVLRRLVSRS